MIYCIVGALPMLVDAAIAVVICKQNLIALTGVTSKRKGRATYKQLCLYSNSGWNFVSYVECISVKWSTALCKDCYPYRTALPDIVLRVVR